MEVFLNVQVVLSVDPSGLSSKRWLVFIEAQKNHCDIRRFFKSFYQPNKSLTNIKPPTSAVVVVLPTLLPTSQLALVCRLIYKLKLALSHRETSASFLTTLTDDAAGCAVQKEKMLGSGGGGTHFTLKPRCLYLLGLNLTHLIFSRQRL